MKNKKIDKFLQSKKEEIETKFDVFEYRIFRLADLRKILKPYQLTFTDAHPYSYANLNIIIDFLIAESYLHQFVFNVYRKEVLYVWRSVPEYLLPIAIRPKGYYSHLSAEYFHGLITSEPKNIYFNNEQPASGKISQELDQERIDLAFNNKQRLSSAKTELNGKVYLMINGKQTGNYGVIQKQILPDLIIPVTDLERTLVDIVVRPAYSGGIENVIRAFQLAKSEVSIQKLAETLRALNFTYPYHQSIGFCLERSGVYDKQEINYFWNYDEIKWNFYLDYQIPQPKYSEKWHLFYPAELEEQ